VARLGRYVHVDLVDELADGVTGLTYRACAMA
jgi:hypothetical protein